MPNLVVLDNDGYLLVQKDLNPFRKVTQGFKCYYQKLSGGLQPNRRAYSLSPNKIPLPISQRYKVLDDQFVVECFNDTYPNSKIYSQAFAAFPDKFRTVEKKEHNGERKLRDFKPADPEMPSLDILVFDSLSRTQFMRHMPKSYEFMTKLGFIFFEGYTKIADNSNVNLLPVLTGHSFEPQVGGNGFELVQETEILDIQKLRPLWKVMKERQCVTMYNDDIGNPCCGVFHYGKKMLRGYFKPPTNYYFRPFHLFSTKVNKDPLCTLTGEFTSEKYLNLWETFSKKYSDYCHFSFNFITMLSHDDPFKIEFVDQKLRDALERLYYLGVFNATAFVIMGDHGNRISKIQYRYVGRIEERAPLFSIRLPDGFAKKYPEQMHRLRRNTKRLISNYDIHETLLNIAEGRFPTWNEYTNRKRRGNSLFLENISTNRSCLEAGIPPNFCLCMQKQGNIRLDRSSNEYKNVTILIKRELKKYPCIKKSSINFEDERLPTYAINQMVRHGLRDAADWPKVANVTAQLEIVFYDVNVSAIAELPRIATRINILFRIKHYKLPSDYTLATEPWITDELFTELCPHRHLKYICSKCA